MSMTLAQYTSYDGLGLAELVRNTEVSPAELENLAFRAMDVVNERLNAVVGRVDPPARADQFDRNAPFAGVPFVVKDLWHGWGGVICNEASRLGEGIVPAADNALAARWRRAGLVVVGRGNTCELGLSGQTDPVIYGAARNPWDLSCSPGASSGGSAAAVGGRDCAAGARQRRWGLDSDAGRILRIGWAEAIAGAQSARPADPG